MSATTVFAPGMAVRLVPTQGAHQKERVGRVVRITATQLVVQPDDAMTEVRFRISDGMPVAKRDQRFPCYKAALSNDLTDESTA